MRAPQRMPVFQFTVALNTQKLERKYTVLSAQLLELGQFLSA